MKKYEEKILNKLIDQYERSKSFSGNTERNQKFKCKITELFSGYDDSSKYDLFISVNEQIAYLERLGVISVKRLKRGKIESEIVDSVQLVLEKLAECYKLLDRTPKTDINKKITEVLCFYQNKTELLSRFCETQLKRIEQNKKVQHFEDIESYEKILKVLSDIEAVEEETIIRNFSIRVLGDSKAFEKIKNRVISILFEYGDFPNKDTILSDLNIVKNPGYVYVKGKGEISISGQSINLSKMDGSIGLGSSTLDDIDYIKVLGGKVVTIENLTTFHSYVDDDAFVIYLGGYHNSIRRKMICKLHENNPNINYLHYGDIDAGGFNILLDLRKKTGIPFVALNMDIITLEKHRQYAKPLTENDKIRLGKLRDGEFADVVNYMLENDCKLEQEAIGFEY